MASPKKTASKSKRTNVLEASLPRPPELDARGLAERFAYPAYTRHAEVRALAALGAKGTVRARIDALFERCVARDLISSTWLTGGAPRCIGPCSKCRNSGVLPSGTIVAHSADCPEADRPHTLEFAVSLVAAACEATRSAVVDAEALAAEWMNALAPWGAPPFRGVLWTYEAHPPALLAGWDDLCDLQPVLLRPAIAAARVSRPTPTLWYGEASAPSYGALGELPWMLEVLEPIDRACRARKKPGQPRRVVNEPDIELLGYALEGASLWHAAITAGAEVRAMPKNRRPEASGAFPAAVIGQTFASMPNPWPALLSLLATGAFPVGSTGGWLALNLAQRESE